MLFQILHPPPLVLLQSQVKNLFLPKERISYSHILLKFDTQAYYKKDIKVTELVAEKITVFVI